ncbi:hypothetical protein Pfo_005194 [Paulownia fortunei]|nr:hypothetical protein Pfo_005194 [Paulownia fortunei]
MIVRPPWHFKPMWLLWLPRVRYCTGGPASIKSAALLTRISKVGECCSRCLKYTRLKIETLSQMIPFFDFSVVEKILVDAVKHNYESYLCEGCYHIWYSGS